jgi:hypothetical protein
MSFHGPHFAGRKGRLSNVRISGFPERACEDYRELEIENLTVAIDRRGLIMAAR